MTTTTKPIALPLAHVCKVISGFLQVVVSLYTYVTV